MIDDAIRAVGAASVHETYSDGTELPTALRAHFVAPLGRSWDWFDPPMLFLGTSQKDSPVAPLHRDGAHGFLEHVLGTKRVLLYSPDQARLLYPHVNYQTSQKCWVRPSAPDYERFPRFADAKPIEVLLQPGDVLILPCGWFHEVYAMDLVLSVSFFLMWEHAPPAFPGAAR
jgi:hypothetical protein